MMKNSLIAGLFLLLFSTLVNAQHYIGYEKDETRNIARKSGFFPDNLTTNQVFNYLKFVNSAGTKTLIVFFSDEQISTHYRIVCDYSEFDFVTREYNEKFRKKGKFAWEYSYENQKFDVTLEEKEWYFVVRVKKKLKKNQVS